MRMLVLSCMLLGVTYAYSQNRFHFTPQKGNLKSVKAEQQMDYQVEGIVHTSDDKSCDAWIEISGHNRVTRLNPVDLPDAYKVEGKHIRFDYGIASKEVSASCGGKSAFVKNVHVAKPYHFSN